MRLAFGTFVIDLDQRRVFNGDTERRLPPKAFDLLRPRKSFQAVTKVVGRRRDRSRLE